MQAKRLVLTLLVTACAAGPAIWAADVAASPEEIRPLLVGAEVPDLTLTAADGTAVELRDTGKEQRAIFVFYRGGW
jgi:hypothetical protein